MTCGLHAGVLQVDEVLVLRMVVDEGAHDRADDRRRLPLRAHVVAEPGGSSPSRRLGGGTWEIPMRPTAQSGRQPNPSTKSASRPRLGVVSEPADNPFALDSEYARLVREAAGLVRLEVSFPEHVIAATPKSWAGTTKTFRVVLDDLSAYEFDVVFR